MLNGKLFIVEHADMMPVKDNHILDRDKWKRESRSWTDVAGILEVRQPDRRFEYFSFGVRMQQTRLK